MTTATASTLTSAAAETSFISKKDENNRIDVVLGGQWGDEGKGKLVDILSQVRQNRTTRQNLDCIYIYILHIHIHIHMK
jgi:hypothetical protein